MATYEGTCEHCGKSYRLSRAAIQEPPRFCSRACFHAAVGAKPPVVKQCDHCGNDFTVKGAYAHRVHFCSRACYWASGGPAKNSPFQEGHSGPRKNRAKVYVGRGDDGKPRYIPRSHWVWNQHHPNDPVQPGEHVHHIDLNKLNDDPTNLQKMSVSDHLSHHASLTQFEERSRRMRAYHAANPGKHRKGQPHICPVCGNEFYRPPSAPQVTCSYVCSGKWSAQCRKEQRE